MDPGEIEPKSSVGCTDAEVSSLNASIAGREKAKGRSVKFQNIKIKKRTPRKWLRRRTKHAALFESRCVNWSRLCC